MDHPSAASASSSAPELTGRLCAGTPRRLAQLTTASCPVDTSISPALVSKWNGPAAPDSVNATLVAIVACPAERDLRERTEEAQTIAARLPAGSQDERGV